MLLMNMREYEWLFTDPQSVFNPTRDFERQIDRRCIAPVECPKVRLPDEDRGSKDCKGKQSVLKHPVDRALFAAVQ